MAPEAETDRKLGIGCGEEEEDHQVIPMTVVANKSVDRGEVLHVIADIAGPAVPRPGDDISFYDRKGRFRRRKILCAIWGYSPSGESLPVELRVAWEEES